LHQLDFNKEFHCLITDSPFPRFSQRDLKLAELAPSAFYPSTGSCRATFSHTISISSFYNR
jgi:hypothetical protein